MWFCALFTLCVRCVSLRPLGWLVCARCAVGLRVELPKPFSNQIASPEQEIFRKALAKAPGERLGRLDKQGRFVPDRVVDKRSVYLNLSSIEELLDQEAVGDGSEEPGCYIEIKIVSSWLLLLGSPVCALTGSSSLELEIILANPPLSPRALAQIKRIPGRCSTLDGRPVCKTDSYYKNSDECLKTV